MGLIQLRDGNTFHLRNWNLLVNVCSQDHIKTLRPSNGLVVSTLGTVQEVTAHLPLVSELISGILDLGFGDSNLHCSPGEHGTHSEVPEAVEPSTVFLDSRQCLLDTWQYQFQLGHLPSW